MSNFKDVISRVKLSVDYDFLIKNHVSYTVLLQNVDLWPILPKNGTFRVTKIFTYQLCIPTEATIYIDMTIYNVNISVKGINLWIQVFVL